LHGVIEINPHLEVTALLDHSIKEYLSLAPLVLAVVEYLFGDFGNSFRTHLISFAASRQHRDVHAVIDLVAGDRVDRCCYLVLLSGSRP